MPGKGSAFFIKRHQALAEAVARARAIAGRSGGAWGSAPV